MHFLGQPADNAAHFVEWLSSLKGSELANVSYTVFGCGNRDWPQTYQRIPTLCDKLLEDHGANRLFKRGEGDAGSAEFFDNFEKWETEMWKAVCEVGESTLPTHLCVLIQPCPTEIRHDSYVDRGDNFRYRDQGY